MKKAYHKPTIEVIEFRFSDQIQASGLNQGGMSAPGGQPIEEL